MPTWRLLTVVTPSAPATSRLDERLPDQTAGRARLAAVRGLPGIVKVSLHLCPHAAGEPPETWWNCQHDPRAMYEAL